VRALVWADGRVLPADRPVLRADDHGVVVGDGVFETVKVVDGRPFALSRHLARLERSAAGLDLPVDRNAVRTAISDLLAAADPPPVRARLRITLTGGPAPLASDRGDAPPTLLAGLGSAAPPPAAGDATRAERPRA
jgi:branched-chain amino acid aminotransferase